MKKSRLLKSGFVAMGMLLAMNMSGCSSIKENDSEIMDQMERFFVYGL